VGLMGSKLCDGDKTRHTVFRFILHIEA
jgi:hypothetical protein